MFVEVSRHVWGVGGARDGGIVRGVVRADDSFGEDEERFRHRCVLGLCSRCLG